MSLYSLGEIQEKERWTRKRLEKQRESDYYIPIKNRIIEEHWVYSDEEGGFVRKSTAEPDTHSVSDTMSAGATTTPDLTNVFRSAMQSSLGEMLVLWHTHP